MTLFMTPPAAYPCTPHNRGACAKPPGGLAPSQVPQFITITWDDAVTSQTWDVVESILGGLKQRNGCPIPSTYFVTVTGGIGHDCGRCCLLLAKRSSGASGGDAIHKA
jgi:hypothetical protein